MVDVAIVGKGPAGLSCAITACLRGVTVRVIAPQADAGWLHKAERIDNYPGLPGISGRELLNSFAEQAFDLGTEEQTGLVRQIMPNGKSFMLLVENEVVEAKAVVLAMGAARPVLLPGEEEAIGRGVSYCATCDGMFYRNKRIAVLSATVQGIEEANFLAGLAGQVDYYFLKKHGSDSLAKNVTTFSERPLEIQRQQTGISLRTADAERIYDGIFIFRAAMPLHMLLTGLETEGSFISVNRKMETNIPGVFAAGDSIGLPLQIAKAAGEGNIAAISAAEFIAKNG